MSLDAYTHSILANQRMNQYLREAAGDRLADEALAARGSLRRRSSSPWLRLFERLGAGLQLGAGRQLGAVWPARPWRGGQHDGGPLPQACGGSSCRD
jgi:hypothetical protein